MPRGKVRGVAECDVRIIHGVREEVNSEHSEGEHTKKDKSAGQHQSDLPVTIAQERRIFALCHV
jgi:hypothetical protein